MNERIKYPIAITAICLVAAAALAFTFALTRERIAAAERGELNAALAVVLPAEAKSVQELPVDGVEGETLYVARANADETGAALGYAAVGVAQGYSSRIHVMVGLTPDNSIYAIRILKQSETPGLGERTKDVPPTKTIWRAIGDAIGGDEGEEAAPAEPPFQQQFRGKTWNELELTKDPSNPNAIHQLTGATITSSAVLNAVQAAVKTIEANKPEN